MAPTGRFSNSRADTATTALRSAEALRGRNAERRWWGIIAFLLIAFGLAGLPFLGIPLGMGAPGAFLMPFAPAIACFVVRKWVTREGFGDAGLRLNLRRWPLYLVALLWPLAVHPLRVLLAIILGVDPPGFAMPWGMARPDFLSLLTWSLLPIAAVPIFFGEEFGWRGYLQIRLLPNRPFAAAVATGVIWGVWHYPLAFAGGGLTSDVGLAMALLLYATALIPASVFFGWLRLRTDSVWPACVAHGANNGPSDILSRWAFTGRESGTLPESSIVPALIAEILVLGVIIVAGDRLLRRWRGGAPAGGTSRRFRGVASSRH